MRLDAVGVEVVPQEQLPAASDLQRLGRIDALAGDGITIAAIARILDLEDRNTALTEENTRLNIAGYR